jgi:hypothetical protein
VPGIALVAEVAVNTREILGHFWVAGQPEGGSKVVKAPLHQAGQPHLGLLLNRAPSRVTARTSPEGGIMMGDTGGDAGVKCAGFSK